MTEAVYPTMEDIQEKLKELSSAHPEAVEVEVIGQSYEGRDIPAAVVTDRNLPADNKEVVLVIANIVVFIGFLA